MIRDRYSSGLAWLGDLPSQWQLKPLGTVFRERRTTVSDREFPPLSVTMGGIVPQMANVALSDNNDQRKLVCSGDFVINSRSDRKGSGGISWVDGSVSVISIVLIPLGIEPRFAHHLLRSAAFQEEFYRWGSGIVADLWSTRYSAMRRIVLPIPPTDEQVAIADFLDRETAKIDALIEKQRALLGALALRRSVLTKTVILGNDGRSGVAFEWYGGPPRHWVIDKLGRHVRVVNGSTPNRENSSYWMDGAFPWLNSSVVNQDRVAAAEQFVTSVALRECHLPVVGPGAVLVGITGQGRTRGMAAQLDMTATINQHVAALIPDPRHWRSRYLTLLMRAAYEELRFISEEAGSTKGAITCADLVAFRVPRPPLAEQDELAAQLDEALIVLDRLESKVVQFIELALERRAALITAAVTGRLDVTTRRVA
jgi:type I restriction enzyme, S subunit